VLGWELGISLVKGLSITYAWIENELAIAGRIQNMVSAQA